MRELAHRPLQGDLSQRFLWLLGLGPDGCLEKANQGVHNRMVESADSTSLGVIGSDRGVLPGLTEDSDSYRERLRRSLDDYQRAGNAWAVLSQVLGYVLAKTPAARTVQTYYSSAGVPDITDWNRYAAGADTSIAPLFQRNATGEWDWDQYTPTQGSWGSFRWYLVLESITPHNWADVAPTWGSAAAMWGEYSGSWGLTTSSLVCRSIKLIIGKWKAGVAHWVIISFDGTEFRPGTPTVDGLYGRWSKLSGDLYVRSRSANGRYFRGQ
jgi:hypothetical protein